MRLCYSFFLLYIYFMKKAVIYSRISTNRAKQNVERQELELKNFAKNNGVKVVKVFEEIASGKVQTIDRVEFKNMMNFIEAEEIKLILCTEISRLGRNNIDVLTTINYFNENKINLYLNDLKFYTLNDDGSLNFQSQLMVNIVSALAENERVQLVDRIKSGLVNACNKGHILTAYPLFGYKVVDKKYVINEKEASIVEEMFQKFIEEKKIFKINHFLSQEVGKTKKGKGWSTPTIKKMLTNTKYNGWYEYKGNKYKVPQIIDNSIFNKVQAILSDNAEKYKSNTNDYQRGKNQRNTHPLSEIVKCGNCGQNLWLNYADKKREHSTYYRCKNNVYKTSDIDVKKCININADLVNSIILDFALYSFNNSSFLEEKKVELMGELDEVKFKIKGCEEIISENKRQANKLKELYKKDLFTLDELESDVGKHRNIIKRNEDDIRIYTSQLIDIEKSIELYTNKVIGYNSEILTAKNFAKFCRENIEKVVVNRVSKESDIYKCWKSKVYGGNRGVQHVYRLEIVSNFVNISVYCSNHTNRYVIETDDYENNILVEYDKFHKGDSMKFLSEMIGGEMSIDEIIENKMTGDGEGGDNYYREFEQYKLMR
ncbi:recombinase family protein [Labilibacter sediminis]|nr:recombinase family protein [Labilibacter sediminis]